MVSGLKTNNTTGYLYRWRKAEDNYLDGVLGDKGVFCSANDLFKWDQGVNTNKIIHRDTLAKAFEPHGKPSYFKSNYGYGWRIKYINNRKIVYHSGWWRGHNSLFLRLPYRNSAIIILANKRNKQFMRTYKEILTILDPDSF